MFIATIQVPPHAVRRSGKELALKCHDIVYTKKRHDMVYG